MAYFRLLAAVKAQREYIIEAESEDEAISKWESEKETEDIRRCNSIVQTTADESFSSIEALDKESETHESNLRQYLQSCKSTPKYGRPN